MHADVSFHSANRFQIKIVIDAVFNISLNSIVFYNITVSGNRPSLPVLT
jgi:hypothetical protein